jgi:hypothetical protein
VEWQIDAPTRQLSVPDPVLRGNTRAFYDLFVREIDRAGYVATEDALRQACEDARVSDARERFARTRAFKRAKQELVELGLIREAAGLVWQVGSAYDDFHDAPLPPEEDEGV